MTTASKDVYDERAEALLHCECGRDDAMYPMPGHRADCPASVRGIVAAELRRNGKAHEDLWNKYVTEVTQQAERIKALEEALKLQWPFVSSPVDDSHYWVVADLSAPLVWFCRWCGRHKIEVKDWDEAPQCDALVKARAALGEK